MGVCGGYVAAPPRGEQWGKMAGTELTTETVELSDGILGIIGAYGMHAALDVRDLYWKSASESAVRRPATADAHATTGSTPMAYR